MGGLSHYFEEEGLATTQISLIREHTEIMRPPRALWVPFELGRPFGAPGDALFQRRVLVSALELLEAPDGPVLADFPDDAPDGAVPDLPLVCPVSFAPAAGATTSLDRLLDGFRSEAATMAGWYDVAIRQRGRTTTVTGLPPAGIIDFLAEFLSGGAESSPLPDVSVAAALRMAAEDLKSIYLEGVAAQPGAPSGSAALADWFWGDTAAGRVINAIREKCLGMPGNDFQLLGKLLLVPRTQMHRFR